MKKWIICIITLFFIILLSFSGCFEESKKEEESAEEALITIPINNFGLTLEDLPEGYTLVSENYSDEPDNPYLLETYDISFSYEGENESCNIFIGISKRDTIENATVEFHQMDYLFHDTYYWNEKVNYMGVEPLQITEKIGKQSNFSVGDFSELSSTYDFMSRTIIVFRISNIVVSILKDDWSNIDDPDPSVTSLSFSKEIAKIIETRINEIDDDMYNFINPIGIEWVKIFEGTNQIANSVQQTEDYGYIICGYVIGDLVPNEYGSIRNDDVLLIKTNSQGIEEWKLTYGDSNSFNQGEMVIQTSDGGYIIVGTDIFKVDSQGTEIWNKSISGICIQETADNSFIILSDEPEGKMIKIDDQGTEIWNKSISGKFIQQTIDGGYIITGSKKDSDFNLPNISLIKTDEFGVIKWEKTYGNESNYEYGTCVKQTSDDGYIISSGTIGLGRNYLIKTDSSGTELWNRSIGGSYIVQTLDGGYIILSNSTRIIKTDKKGIIEWTKQFPVDPTYNDELNADWELNSYAITSDEGIILTGINAWTEQDGNEYNRMNQVLLIKTKQE